jgi:hypothetical protein
MLSDSFIQRFRSAMKAAENPAGAFDVAPSTKGNTMPKYRYTPLANTAGQLFLRERSANLAFDEATEITDKAKEILDFLRDKISADDLHQVEESLKMEAGVPIDSQNDAEAMITGAKARGAQDAKRRQLALDASADASSANIADFATRFPGAARVGHV